MATNANMIEEFSFSTEDTLVGACSAALWKVKSLAEQAPIGRLFNSIQTLAEVSNEATRQINANNLRAASIALRTYADQEEVIDFVALSRKSAR